MDCDVTFCEGVILASLSHPSCNILMHGHSHNVLHIADEDVYCIDDIAD